MRQEYLKALAKGEDLYVVKRDLHERIDRYRDAWRKGVDDDFETAQLIAAAMKQPEGSEARNMAEAFMADANALLISEREEETTTDTTTETEGPDDDSE